MNRFDCICRLYLLRHRGKPQLANSAQLDDRRDSDSPQVTIACPSRAQAGFSLAETLLALVILVAMTGMVAMGVPAAASSYSKAVETSNAQAALTNVTASLRNELGLASEVWLSDSGEVVAFLSSEEVLTRIRNSDQEDPYNAEWKAEIEKKKTRKGVIRMDMYKGRTCEGKPESRDLVPKEAITKELRVTFNSIKYENGIFIVDGLKVTNASDEDGKMERASTPESKFEVKAMFDVEEHPSEELEG